MAIVASKNGQEFRLSADSPEERLVATLSYEQLYRLAFDAGQYDRMRIAGNFVRPMDKKTEQRVPASGRREVVPKSRPRDAGPVLRYRWEKDITTAPRAWRDGYEAGLRAPVKVPLYGEKPTVYGIDDTLPTTQELAEPMIRARAIQEGRAATMKQKGDSRKPGKQGSDRMFRDLDELQRLKISGKAKYATLPVNFAETCAQRWGVPVSEATWRIQREFSVK